MRLRFALGLADRGPVEHRHQLRCRHTGFRGECRAGFLQAMRRAFRQAGFITGIAEPVAETASVNGFPCSVTRKVRSPQGLATTMFARTGNHGFCDMSERL